MAGRLLPIALATIAGVSIGIATFGREFEKLQKQRLEEEYKRDLAALSSQKGEQTSPSATSTVNLPVQEHPTPELHPKTSSTIASFLGTWAWKKEGSITSASKENASIDPNSKRSSENKE